MFKTFINTTVDTIQSTKKIAIDTFVKHEGLSKSLTDFVDAQTEYTKKAIDAGMNAGTNMYSAVTDKSLYTNTLEAMQAFFNTQKGK